MSRYRTRLGSLLTLAVSAVFWIAVAVVAVVVFSGCSTGPRRACDSCIGPYDVTLRSHREALEDRGLSDAEGAALAEYLRRLK